MESIIAHDLQASADRDEPSGPDVKYERWLFNEESIRSKED